MVFIFFGLKIIQQMFPKRMRYREHFTKTDEDEMTVGAAVTKPQKK